MRQKMKECWDMVRELFKECLRLSQ
jgi:hypothetical protein